MKTYEIKNLHVRVYNVYNTYKYYINNIILRAENRRKLIQVIGYYVLEQLNATIPTNVLTVKYLNKYNDTYNIKEVQTLENRSYVKLPEYRVINGQKYILNDMGTYTQIID